jgi:hypothetical protein
MHYYYYADDFHHNQNLFRTFSNCFYIFWMKNVKSLKIIFKNCSLTNYVVYAGKKWICKKRMKNMLMSFSCKDYYLPFFHIRLTTI